jgi:hypothetical protein
MKAHLTSCPANQRNLRFVCSAIVLSLVFCGTAHGVLYQFVGTFGQECTPCPTGGSPGTGTANFILDSATSIASYNIAYAGMAGIETIAHVHGPATLVPCQSAGVIYGLPAGQPKIGNSPVLTAAQIADMKAGKHYVNIHTNLCGNGEIRAQLFEVPQACCLPGGACTMSLVDSCLQQGGTPQGPNTSCSPTFQACCLPNGSCVMVDPLCCDDIGGILQPAGALCTQREACCLPNPLGGMDCLMLDPLCCTSRGGTVQPSGSVCSSPQRCCLPSGGCVDVDPLCCDDLGGVAGPGSCTSNPCPPPPCGPDPTNPSRCLQVQCPVPPGGVCQPKCVNFNPLTGQTTVLNCECGPENQCHVLVQQGTQPTCVGNCPPGMICQETVTPRADGTIDICCTCVTPPCEPDPQIPTQCRQTPCANPNQTCLPRCARLVPGTPWVVTVCDCIPDTECHLQMPGAAGGEPSCVGGCPPGFVCFTERVVHSDGSIDFCCRCLQPCVCVGDVDHSCIINGGDIDDFIKCLLQIPQPVPLIPPCDCADIDGNGVIDMIDVDLFVRLLLSVPKPICPTSCVPGY